MRKAEVLLAYLALTPGIRHPRERLINLLWSDRGEEQARNSLRQCLSAIKKSLGDVADMVLQVDRTTVSLIPELIDIDVHEFERLAAEGGYESLTTAADLYQGEFLEGISIRDAACQEWLDGERGRFKRQFIEILSNLAETQLLSHDFSHAIKSAERLVKQDPLGESGWRILIRSYFEHGDRSHALQAFKRCEQVLRDELDVDPQSATIELRDQIAGGAAKPGPTPTPAVSKAPVASTASNDHSIAVLPFDNLSGDPEQEYFSDGITDSIILNLSLFPGLQVKSRNSSFAFKQQIKSIGEISTELNVDYIVEGSIRRSDQHIRITVQLIDAAEGNQIWGKRYDADISDLFSLEENLSRTIAATVTGQIESELQRIAIAKGATDQQSYDLLLSGIYHNQRYNRQDTVIAIEKLNQCLAKDPDNVRALMWIYVSHLLDYLGRWTEDYLTSFKLAAENIQKAMAMAPESCTVQVFYAQYLVFCSEFEKATKHLDMALETNPNDPTILTTMALNLEMQGQAEDALQFAERACLLDPYHPWAEWEVAVSQFISGQYEATLKTITKMRTSPGFIQIFGIASNVKLGRIDPARQALQSLLQESRESMLSMPQTIDEWLQYTRENYPFADPQINQDIIECMIQAGLSEEVLSPHARIQSSEHGIAVLPFDNLSGDPAQEYFSDGITESIILNLSLFPGLNVKSRNSSFAFKQQIKSPDEISKELEVDYIVEGSIRKTDKNIRVTVQLVDAKSDNQVWGKRYDAEIENLFDLEEELSRSIAATVTGQIESDLQRIAITKGAAHQQAYDLLLAGRHHANKGNAQETLTAIDKLNQCLALDPDNALAHTELFWCHDINVIDRWVEDIEDARKLADEHIHKAFALAPDLTQVKVAYADYLAYRYRYEEADRQLQQALEKNPNDAEAIAMQAVNLSLQGKAEAALEKAELALRLDPYHSWVRWIQAESLYFSGRYEDCLATIAGTGNAPAFIQIYNIAANIKLERLENAQKALTAFLQFCRQNMLSMPKTIPQWLDYYRDNAPFANPALNQDIIDYLLRAGLEEEMAATQKSTGPEALPSILVLPFSNLSGDPEQEYFSDGISESIIVSLSSFSGLNVKSRHTSFAFKNSAKGIDEIVGELAVQYIVEGSIRKFGDKVRITVQVDETASGNQLWGKRFDCSLEDLFSIEEEMVKNIAGTISGRIGKELKNASLKKPKKDLKSFDYLMRGLHHLEKFNVRDNLIARKQFQLSIKCDPDNGEAHSMLGETYVMELLENWTADREEARRMMRLYAEKAIELEPDNALTHAFMSEQLVFARDFGRAEIHADRAIELNPTLPDGYTMKCGALSVMRRYEEALEYADMSMQIDPYHPYVGWTEGEVYLSTGQYERAIKAFRSIPHMSPSLHAQTAAALAGMNETDKARTEMQHYLELAQAQMANFPANEHEWREYWYEAMPFQYIEDSNTFFDLLLQAGLCDQLEITVDSMPSIAVLPFENMSGDPEQEYFSDGITSSIILSLGLFDGLAVKSQNSSFAFKNSGKSSEEISDELNVTYLVEGSFRKSAHKVRISVQLIESATGNQVWGKQYDAELEDILELEQELSQTIAGTISGRIGHTLQQSAARKAAKNLQSYDYLLRGLYYFGKFTASDFVKARQEIEKCLEIDPENSTAHTNLGMINWIDILEGWTDDQANSESLTRYHLETAIKIEPDNALAHSYFGEYLFFKRNYEQSEFHVDKAIELNPTASEGYVVKADLLGFTRRIDEAIPYADRALQLDPHSVGAGWSAGGVYQGAGQFEKAIKTYRSIPHPPASIHASIAACFNGLGLAEEARKEMKRYQELAKREMPNYPTDENAWRRLWRISQAYRYDEDFEVAFDQLVQAGLLEDLTGPFEEMPSIAVLPFENMSGDSEQGYFSDGITTDIISTLSKFRHMRIVARHSTMQYKGRNASIEDISKQQGVRYILEGSVRKSGDRIRVNADLIDSQNKQIVWSEHYDRDLDDLFAVQDEMSMNIALAMKVHLDDGEMALHRSAGTTNIKAWQLTLEAIDLQDTYIQKNILEARNMAKQAIELDPGYPYAWVSLGWTHWQEVYIGRTESFEDALAEAEKANNHALSLAPEYSEAWSLAGTIHLMKHETDEMLAAFSKAIELQPGNAEIQALTAFAYIFIGDFEQARTRNQNMLQLCPVLPNWYYLIQGQIEQFSGSLDDAIDTYRRGIDVEPDSPLCRFYLVHALVERGDEAMAKELATEIRALDSSVTGKGLVRSLSINKALRDRFQASLEKFGLY
jgi:TolB-like protein/DNA-binding SARP family transcriptional activator/Flp pilus assembly protein TadD